MSSQMQWYEDKGASLGRFIDSASPTELSKFLNEAGFYDSIDDTDYFNPEPKKQGLATMPLFGDGYASLLAGLDFSVASKPNYGLSLRSVFGHVGKKAAPNAYGTYISAQMTLIPHLVWENSHSSFAYQIDAKKISTGYMTVEAWAPIGIARGNVEIMPLAA